LDPYEALIAGTESITEAILNKAENLRLIARVGIGLDSVALNAARRRGIAVTYTPSAPSPAVAELTIGQMLALLRKTVAVDHEIRDGAWHRRIGRRLALMTVGIIGVGRIAGWSSGISKAGVREFLPTTSSAIPIFQSNPDASGQTWTQSIAKPTLSPCTSR
jgi:phosphoglycerate dehydrogenase-like enzyme